MLVLEFYKDHFRYQHDEGSTIISPFLNFPEKGQSKNGIRVLCILAHNLNMLRFYEKTIICNSTLT